MDRSGSRTSIAAASNPEAEGAAGTDAWEQELLRRFWQGDNDAFGELLRFYQVRVFSLVFRMVGRRAEAEELTQEAFLQAYKAIHRFREVRPFRPWLFRVAINVCRNHRRAAARRESPQDIYDGQQPMWQRGSDDPEHLILRQAEARRLDVALAKLPLDERSLFLLRSLEGLSYEELREVFGVREGVLRVRFHRTAQRLRALLSGSSA